MADNWISRSSPPSWSGANVNAGSLLVWGDYGYYWGGGNGDPVGVVPGRRYHFPTDVWADLGDAPHAWRRHGPSAGVVREDGVLLYFGQAASTSRTCEVYRYDAESGLWLSAGPSILTTSDPGNGTNYYWTVCKHGNYAYLFAGIGTWRYHLWNNTWESGLAKRPQIGGSDVWCNVPSFLYDGEIWLSGGATGQGGGQSWTDKVDIYDPATNTWRSMPGLPQAVYDHSGAVAPNGHPYAYYFGGRDLGGSENDFWLHHLETGAFDVKTAPGGSGENLLVFYKKRLFVAELETIAIGPWMREYVPDVWLGRFEEGWGQPL